MCTNTPKYPCQFSCVGRFETLDIFFVRLEVVRKSARQSPLLLFSLVGAGGELSQIGATTSCRTASGFLCCPCSCRRGTVGIDLQYVHCSCFTVCGGAGTQSRQGTVDLLVGWLVGCLVGVHVGVVEAAASKQAFCTCVCTCVEVYMCVIRGIVHALFDPEPRYCT